MEAVGLSDHKDCLLHYRKKSFLPVISINGKNGGGKSNVIRAFWLATQFINNAQRSQHETAEVPVTPFELNDYSRNEPTSFEFEYTNDGIWFRYGFSATRKQITQEHLYWAPNGQKSIVFQRYFQDFVFPSNSEKKNKELISKAVGTNQLFFAVSCTMNYEPCIKAMKWFREKVVFSKKYSDFGSSIFEYREDPEMLKSVLENIKKADLGISDMKFEFDNKTLSDVKELLNNLHTDAKKQITNALLQFKNSLSANSGNYLENVQYNDLKTTLYHIGLNSKGEKKEYPLNLSDESDGTIRLMALAIAIGSAIKNGGILFIDDIEDKLHPKIVEYIINRFQKNNQNDSQLIFTTHSVDIMNRELLRRDQLYLVDKNELSGTSSLYSVADLSVRNDEKIGKSYLLGKYGAIPHIQEK